jgi:hypothetical protein
MNTAKNWLVTAVLLALASCASFNPMSNARTAEQRAWALYGTYVVFQEQAAGMVKDPAVSLATKEALKRAEAASYPVAEGLFTAGQEVIAVRRQLEAGTTGAEQMDIAMRNLSEWYMRAQPLVTSLVDSVRGDK